MTIKQILTISLKYFYKIILKHYTCKYIAVKKALYSLFDPHFIQI